MYVHVKDGHFDQGDLLHLRKYALSARATKLFKGYRKISLSKIHDDPNLANIIKRSSELVPADAVLDQGWFMVYNNKCDGIPLHADYAYMTVNIWITPDSCIKNYKKNGMVIYELQAPADWSFEKFNGDSEGIGELINKHTPKLHTIPYAFNRAVVFRSNMFHATDGVETVQGSLHRRVNLSLMYKKV